MLKVIYLRSSFNPGGTESLLLNLFNYNQSEIQFHYILLKPGELIKLLDSNNNKYYKFFRRNNFDLNIILKISRLIQKEDIRIVHTHQPIELFFAVFVKLFNPKIKIYHTVHGFLSKEQKWAKWLEIFLMSFTVKVLTVSNAAKNSLIEQGYSKTKIDVLYNAVKPPKKIEEQKKIEFLNEINYQPNDFIIGMIGNFVWQKDQQTIVKSFKLCNEEFTNLKLVFIGNDNSYEGRIAKEEASNLKNNKIYFLGPMTNASTYLELFNLFIFSSIADTFGIAVIEALMQKVPVIASDIDLMKEISQNGKLFVLFEQKNPLNLAEKILTLYKKINLNQIDLAYENVMSNYNYDVYIKKLMKYYKS